MFCYETALFYTGTLFKSVIFSYSFSRGVNSYVMNIEIKFSHKIINVYICFLKIWAHERVQILTKCVQIAKRNKLCAPTSKL